MAVNGGKAKLPGATVEVTTTRRMEIGLNVALTVVLAAALVVGVNWFATLKHLRADVATFGSFGLSDRTRSILAGVNDDVRITTVYLSTEPDKARERFIDRLMSYGDELTLASNRVTVEHISTEDAKARLVTRVRSTYEQESQNHEAVIRDFASLRSELEQTLAAFGGAGLGELSAAEGWLSYFPIYRSVLDVFAEDRQSLGSAAEEVARLTDPTALPNYGQAVNKISATLRPIKDQLTQAQRALGEIDKLAQEIQKPDGTLISTLRDLAQRTPGMTAALKATINAESDQAPADAKGALAAFAAEAQKTEESMRVLGGQIDDIARRNAALGSHVNWQLVMDLGILQSKVTAADLLAMAARDLRQSRQQILDIVDRGDPGAIGQALTTVRGRVMPAIDQRVHAVGETLDRLLKSLETVDPASAKILEQSRGGQLFGKQIAAIGDLLGRIDNLPELKLGQLAEELRRDNIIVVEANQQVRVLGFDDVWPVRDQLSSGMAMQEERPRTFNGDATIGGAILSLTSKRPFATIVLTSFEVEPPPQARQFMQPQRSSIPLQALAALRERLKNANFAVKEWDLSKAGDAPPADEGTERIFVFLPPAPPNPPNPFMGQQQPSRSFGEEERKRVEAVLANGGRGVFVATWEVTRSFFGSFETPPYGMDALLREGWGIVVDTPTRLFQIEPDTRAPNQFMVTIEKFNYMPLNNFSDHPIGAPLRNSRVIVTNACPVTAADKIPEGVTLEPVLSIPSSEEFIAADVNKVIEIINVIEDPESNGIVQRDGFVKDAAVPVVMAARRAGDGNESRIVVFGTGYSLTDGYLNRPIQRMGEKGRVYYEGAPTSNADLMVNALHWLAGQEQWIAAGPVPAPAIRAIPPQQMTMVKIGVWGVFPALVFIPGIMAWWSRRR